MEKRLSGWKRELVRAHGLIAGLFARSKLRARSLGYVQGLLSGCERKNGWQSDEWLGEATPYAVQDLLDRARWDADKGRDRIRSYVIDELGSEEAVLIVDETGFLKKGRHSAWGKRQYSARRGASRRARWSCFSPMGVKRLRRWRTAHSTLPVSGQRTASAVVRPISQNRLSLPPSRSWRGK